MLLPDLVDLQRFRPLLSSDWAIGSEPATGTRIGYPSMSPALPTFRDQASAQATDT